MDDNSRKPTGHSCQQQVNPAPQPKPPGWKTCDDLQPTNPPDLKKPEDCPAPPKCCKCPPTPSTTSNCLETLIAKQSADILAAEKAKAFKADLEKLLDSAKKASAAYTQDKYKDLLKKWKEQDLLIAKLVNDLVCTVRCWRCILDCHICPLLNELHYAEQWLYDGGKLYTEVNDLYDLQYWHTRYKAAKEREFNRIDSVMKAWSNPAKTIEDALTANAELIKSAGGVLGTEPGKAIYDVFFRLLPLHLAIAPPVTPGSNDTTTTIDAKFTEFCECNKGEPDDCCGPDVGAWSLRQRLVGPQPYLINPNDYFKVICCLVERRYSPAKDALSKAETDLAAVTDRIARAKAQLEDGLKNFAATAKGAVPSVINCCKYDGPVDEPTQKSSAYVD